MRACVVGLMLAAVLMPDRSAAPFSPGQQPTAQRPPKRPEPNEPTAADFAELSTPSSWVLDEFKGRVPNPAEDQEHILQGLPARLKQASQHPLSSQEEVKELADDFLLLAAIPPEAPIVLDFVSDLSGALAEATMSDRQFKLLTEQLYVAFNSAGLDGPELKGLLKDIDTVLRGGGGPKDRVQTVLYDITAINEFIKEPG